MNPAMQHIGLPDIDFWHTDESDWRREAAWHLCAQMGAHSEDVYCASWLLDLEYELWAIGAGEASPGLFDERLCRDLVALARLVDCWWFCPHFARDRPNFTPHDRHIGQRRPVDLATWERMRQCRRALDKASRCPGCGRRWLA
jgi:hypothetical protein